jgi:hypothetical protein
MESKTRQCCTCIFSPITTDDLSVRKKKMGHSSPFPSTPIASPVRLVHNHVRYSPQVCDLACRFYVEMMREHGGGSGRGGASSTLGEQHAVAECCAVNSTQGVAGATHHQPRTIGRDEQVDHTARSAHNHLRSATIRHMQRGMRGRRHTPA